MISLITVHVLMLLHIAYWLKFGSTITPVEPSESMETLKTGAINAGFIFFALAILLTLIFGRFVCGWACHFLAYQDLCGWMLKRMRIQPKPLRSRLLMLVPLGMALYMFAWPVVYRWYAAFQDPTNVAFVPQWSSAFTTEHFWETFPGWVFAILTFTVSGFSIVYFLGNKGFCTYACPYGGVFAIVEKASPLRVRVNESCVQSGECTKSCGSNVRVAEEVLAYGMVVDPGCMKCADCITSCPTSALSFGFGKTAVLATPDKPEPQESKPKPLPLIEELILAGGFAFFLYSWWGLYDHFPFLMSAGISAIFAFVLLTFVRLIRNRDVEFQNVTLKADGKLRSSGQFAMGAAGLLLVATSHNAYIQTQNYLGDHYYDATGIGEILWEEDFEPERDLAPVIAGNRDLAIKHYDNVKRWAIVDAAKVNNKLTWLNLLRGDEDAAEESARKALAIEPKSALMHHNLARVLKKRKAYSEAIDEFRKALDLDHSIHEAEKDLGLTLLAARRLPEALEHFEHMLEHAETNPQAHYHAGAIALELGDLNRADSHLTTAIEQDPKLADAYEQMGLLMMNRQQTEEAIEQFKKAIELDPTLAKAQYNLAVAYFIRRDIPNAIQEAEKAMQLDPNDKQIQAFLKMLRQQPIQP